MFEQSFDFGRECEQAAVPVIVERFDSQPVARAEKLGDPELRASFLERVPENARTLERARAWLPEGAPLAPDAP